MGINEDMATIIGQNKQILAALQNAPVSTGTNAPATPFPSDLAQTLNDTSDNVKKILSGSAGASTASAGTSAQTTSANGTAASLSPANGTTAHITPVSDTTLGVTDNGALVGATGAGITTSATPPVSLAGSTSDGHLLTPVINPTSVAIPARYTASISALQVADASQSLVGPGLFSVGQATIGGVSIPVDQKTTLTSFADQLRTQLQAKDPSATVNVGGDSNSLVLTVTSALINGGFTGPALTGNTPNFTVHTVAAV